MALYLGYIEQSTREAAIYYNFNPLGVQREGRWHIFTPEELAAEFPDSSRGNINLNYTFTDPEERAWMERHYPSWHLLVLSFTADDLMPNLIRGRRNPTGYKVRAREFVSAGRVFPMGTQGLYTELTPGDYTRAGEILQLTEQGRSKTMEGDQVLVSLGSRGALGPYMVNGEGAEGELFIRLHPTENRSADTIYERASLTHIPCCAFTILGVMDWSLTTIAPDAPKKNVDRKYLDRLFLDTLVKLVLQNSDSEASQRLLTALIEEHPEFLEKLPGVGPIHKKIEEGMAQVQRLSNITPSMTPQEVVDYVVSTLQIARPGYHRNTIVNLLICVTQGFLTVLSGDPGCGKTSVSNLMGQVLGLTDMGARAGLQDPDGTFDRYLPVSVERGWTSKRDLVGYYNPLSKSFEESNGRVYDALRILDLEARRSSSPFPFLILLDEANLSPMEYYWADFMNICDDLRDNHQLNLGNQRLNVPETLHFLATINNDHTTETLSPRLIDRAWIITLPRPEELTASRRIPAERIRQIRWKDLKAACSGPSSTLEFTQEIQQIFEGLGMLLKKADIRISPRTELAIRRYWHAASCLMTADPQGIPAPIAAMDYAISQKILPSLCGCGDEYRMWLEEFRTFCRSNHLSMSEEILDRIINRGNRQMKYYQFF